MKLAPRAAFTGRLRVKIRRPFRNPRDEFREAWVRAECVDCGIVAREFALGQCRVDFVVTDLVEKHSRPALAAPELRHEVVQALLGVRRDGAFAQWADGVAHG